MIYCPYHRFILFTFFIGITHHCVYGRQTINSVSDSSINESVKKLKQTTAQVRKRNTTGVKKKNTTFKQMTETELKELQHDAISKKNFPLAIKCLEQRMRLSHTPEILANLIYELGEIQFEFGKFDLTIITLNDFKKKFPGHQEIEEAHYKICVASFLNTLGSERDQTNTDTAIDFANEYLSHPASFKKYRSEVQAFKHQALQQKADHELMICQFHKKRGQLTAAKKRLAYVEKEFAFELPELSSQVLALKEELVLSEQKSEQKKQILATNHHRKHNKKTEQLS